MKKKVERSEVHVRMPKNERYGPPPGNPGSTRVKGYVQGELR